MNCASVPNLLSSTKFPAHSVDGGGAVLASIGWGWSIALLVMAVTEFVAIAGSAFFAIVYDRLMDPAALARPDQHTKGAL